MSTSSILSEWNFRVHEKRLVTVKLKNVETRRLAVLDELSNMVFSVDAISPTVDIQNLSLNAQYTFTLNVYTSKNLEDVEKDFIGFFEAVDVDQEMEDFIRANLVCPEKIRFELIEVEEP